jgi:hypothetical protein
MLSLDTWVSHRLVMALRELPVKWRCDDSDRIQQDDRHDEACLLKPHSRWMDRSNVVWDVKSILPIGTQVGRLRKSKQCQQSTKGRLQTKMSERYSKERPRDGEGSKGCRETRWGDVKDGQALCKPDHGALFWDGGRGTNQSIPKCAERSEGP